MQLTQLSERLRRFIAQQEASGNLAEETGIAVSVVRENDVLFTGTYGLRDREARLPVTSDTIFEISSLAKAFTSTALLIAAEAGQLDLDQAINSKQARLRLAQSEVYEQISITDMLSHRTGLPSHDLHWYVGPASPEAFTASLSKLDFVPGIFRKELIYSNLLYGALGHLYPDFTGETWSNHLTHKILVPLRMNATSLAHTPSVTEKNIAAPYVGTRRVGPPNFRAIAPAAMIRSNLTDLNRWMGFLLSMGKSITGEQLIAETILEQAWKPRVSARTVSPLILRGLEWLDAETLEYGLGWFMGAYQGKRVVFHPGLIDGYSVAIALIPEDRIGVVVLTNANLSSVPGLMIQEVLRALRDEESKKTPPITSSASDVGTSSAVARELVTLPGELSGDFFDEAYGKLSIFQNAAREWSIKFRGEVWPLEMKTAQSAVFSAYAFGLQIPIGAELGWEGSRLSEVRIPFSFDARVAPQIFRRKAWARDTNARGVTS